MKLRPALYSFIVEDLKQLVRLCGGPGPDGARKEQLVEYIAGRLTNPVALAEIWRRLDPLSQKAVATAYYAGPNTFPTGSRNSRRTVEPSRGRVTPCSSRSAPENY